MSMCSIDYLQAIKNAGGTPFVMAPLKNDEYIDNVLDICDGILFSGGSDINSMYYDQIPGESGRIIPERDEFEMELLKKATQRNKAILGICRGLQLINIFYEGTMNQDIKMVDTSYNKHDIINLPRWHDVHKVKLEKNSHIANAYKKNEIKTNSLHHQSINKLGKGLKITARAHDGTIEGIEAEDKYFLTAVQWHPEMMFKYSKVHLNLFEYFIKKVIENKEN